MSVAGSCPHMSNFCTKKGMLLHPWRTIRHSESLDPEYVIVFSHFIIPAEQILCECRVIEVIG